ncbi:8749_t:CDS:1, partial [Diversispora eburnea]
IQFSPAIISKLCNNPIERPQPTVSINTHAFQKWTMPIPQLNDIYK